MGTKGTHGFTKAELVDFITEQRHQRHIARNAGRWSHVAQLEGVSSPVDVGVKPQITPP